MFYTTKLCLSEAAVFLSVFNKYFRAVVFVPILPALMNREYLLRSDITLALARCRTVHKFIQIKRPCKEILMFVCAQHGERVRVTRWKKYWLYGDKVQVEGQVNDFFLNLSIFKCCCWLMGTECR